uniref:Phosphoinositide phospholipase C n=1 Tax=Sinocyclocheilus rhinocerous TaxID=307959 RepID=A0A673N426_9TELE
MYNRYFLLDPDMRWLRWEPSKKDSEKAKLEIKSIKEVRLGKKTPVLRKAYCELCTRPEIFFLLVQFSSNKEYLDSKDLMLFVEVEQGVEGVTEEMCREIVHKYEPSAEGRNNGYLSIDGFTHYLLSSECHIFDPQHKHVCQDMTQPLSHYYINSSHNASLLEDHYWGSSDLSSYVRALRMGCRSLEVVVWDGADCEPVVYVGSSVASQLAFCKVLDVINQYAFESSEYPLILCLVTHCSVPQQRVMAQHLKKILGDKLHVDPPNMEDHYLPSPEKLKGKILIKGKKGFEMFRRMMGGDDKDQLNGIGCKRLRLCKELSQPLILKVLVIFKSHSDFETSKREQKHWEICSFNEVDANRFANEFPEDFVSYNKRFLSRVYPTPMRIDASNMNPQDFWKCGCQIVAMNYQTPGLMMDLNLGWFRQNGNCGYVLRPAIMREEVSYFSANARDSLPGVSAQLLHIKVISGQNLPKPRGSAAKGDVVEPYIYVEIHGIPADCAEQRTKTVSQNGDNPIFDESFEFQINLPELAALRFVVLDDDYIGDEFIGQYTIPFECLLPGYRHVPLQSLTGEFLPNTTLTKYIWYEM